VRKRIFAQSQSVERRIREPNTYIGINSTVSLKTILSIFLPQASYLGYFKTPTVMIVSLDTPKHTYKCDHPGCSRIFVRADLCARHKERHTSEAYSLQHNDASETTFAAVMGDLSDYYSEIESVLGPPPAMWMSAPSTPGVPATSYSNEASGEPSQIRRHPAHRQIYTLPTTIVSESQLEQQQQQEEPQQAAKTISATATPLHSEQTTLHNHETRDPEAQSTFRPPLAPMAQLYLSPTTSVHRVESNTTNKHRLITEDAMGFVHSRPIEPDAQAQDDTGSFGVERFLRTTDVADSGYGTGPSGSKLDGQSVVEDGAESIATDGSQAPIQGENRYLLEVAFAREISNRSNALMQESFASRSNMAMDLLYAFSVMIGKRASTIPERGAASFVRRGRK
jgi:hypothetical protein